MSKKLIINAGFVRTLPNQKREFKDIQGIEIQGLEWKKDGPQIRKALMKHAPGPDWTLTGYANVTPEKSDY